MKRLVTSKADDANLGDAVVETAFFDYRDVEGIMLPMRVASAIDAYPVAD